MLRSLPASNITRQALYFTTCFAVVRMATATVFHSQCARQNIVQQVLYLACLVTVVRMIAAKCHEDLREGCLHARVCVCESKQDSVHEMVCSTMFKVT